MQDFSPAQFTELLDLAAAWAEDEQRRIVATGRPLNAGELSVARQMGVQHPERVRVLAVSSIPVPAHPILRNAAEATRLISPLTAGLTLEYGIFMRQDLTSDRRLLAHELVHTGQYERFGSVRAFLAQYLNECLTIGYPASPLEQEAVMTSANLKDFS